MSGAHADRLFRAHGDVVLRRARQILRNEDEAREVLQEVFASLLERPPRWSEIASPVSYLYVVTTNLCLKRIRSRRTQERLLKARFPQPSIEERPRAEHGAVVAQLLESMPEELAMVTVYYYLDDMSHAEIAELMGCSRRHIGDLLERARDFVARAERRAS